jgi:enterochelin esterase-like enzyme
VIFRVPDPDGRWTAVRLASDIPAPNRDFERRDRDWVLELPAQLQLHRVEYELEVEHAGGGKEWIADPSHGTRAPGAFGEKSVLEAEQYTPPWWLDAPAVDGLVTRVPLGIAMRRRVTADVWAPVDIPADHPLPALVAHDGPEYDKLARLTQWAAAIIAAGRLPPFRLVMLPPGDRDNWYSASEGYAKAFAQILVPALRDRVAVERPLVGMGASLGALEMLHVHRRFPGVVGGLFLQSGSFFTMETDPQEIRFSRFGRITPFVRGVLRTKRFEHPVPTAMTCGAEEENAANNRLMAEALARQGYPVEYVENPDMHNYTNWRDTLDPHLTGLCALMHNYTNWRDTLDPHLTGLCALMWS